MWADHCQGGYQTHRIGRFWSSLISRCLAPPNCRTLSQVQIHYSSLHFPNLCLVHRLFGTGACSPSQGFHRRSRLPIITITITLYRLYRSRSVAKQCCFVHGLRQGPVSVNGYRPASNPSPLFFSFHRYSIPFPLFAHSCASQPWEKGLSTTPVYSSRPIRAVTL